jgi:hypothetical protein
MNNPHQGARLTVHSRELIVARYAEGRAFSTPWSWMALSAFQQGSRK